MSEASALEQQMLELINAERAANGLDPVQLELRLNDSAEDHSTWMLDQDVFSHTGAGGSSAGDRIEDAGFVLSGNWRWSENIAWQSERGDPGLEDDVVDLHNSLMNSPGHRANILDPNVTVVGIGIELGEFNGYTAVMVTQNFARTSADLQLDNGVTVQDDPPEPDQPAPPPPDDTPTSGADNITLTSPRLIELLNGNDFVRGSDGNDTIEGDNGQDTLFGGLGDDLIISGRHDDVVNGNQGNDVINAGGGNDRISGDSGADTLRGGLGDDTIDGGADADQVYGGLGRDELAGGAGNDSLSGDGGQDSLNGGEGNDTLVGGRHNDTLDGGDGEDRLFGGNGWDFLDGGIDDDRLFGGRGQDTLDGGTGDDRLFGGRGKDTLDGGAGDDRLSGGLGSDTFVFSEGTDRVNGFNHEGVADQVDLSAANGISDFDDLIANHLEASNGNLQITDDNDNVLILLQTDLNEIDNSTFLF